MTEYLNVWVGGAIMASVPLKTDDQKAAADKIFLGQIVQRHSDVVMIIEDIPRKIYKV